MSKPASIAVITSEGHHRRQEGIWRGAGILRAAPARRLADRWMTAPALPPRRGRRRFSMPRRAAPGTWRHGACSRARPGAQGHFGAPGCHRPPGHGQRHGMGHPSRSDHRHPPGWRPERNGMATAVSLGGFCVFRPAACQALAIVASRVSEVESDGSGAWLGCKA